MAYVRVGISSLIVLIAIFDLIIRCKGRLGISIWLTTVVCCVSVLCRILGKANQKPERNFEENNGSAVSSSVIVQNLGDDVVVCLTLGDPWLINLGSSEKMMIGLQRGFSV